MMKKCLMCGKTMPDAAEFCDVCFGPLGIVEGTEAPTPTPAAEPVAAPASQQPTPKKGLVMANWLKLALVAVVALGALVAVGWLTNWFGLASPVAKLGKAIVKTADADSLTVKYSVKETYSNGHVYRDSATMKVVVDKKKEKVTFLSESDGSTMLYDNGDEYYYREPEGDDRGYASIYEGDDDELSETVFDAYEDIYDGKKIHWDELIKTLDLDDYVDHKEVDEFVKTVYKECLNDRKWLKECLGLEKKGNTYTFEPDVAELGDTIIDLVDDSDAFRRKAKQGIEDEVDYYVELVDDYDVEFTVTITLKRGYLSAIHVEGSNEYGDEYELEIEITDINKTTIDTKKIKGEVEDLMDEYACDECGEDFGEYEMDDGEYWCYDCYYSCVECGDEWASYERDGMRLCYDCYYTCAECGVSDAWYEDEDKYYCYDHSERCEKCDDRCGYTYYVNSEEWCEDCYDECHRCGDDDASYTYQGKRWCSDCYWD